MNLHTEIMNFLEQPALAPNTTFAVWLFENNLIYGSELRMISSVNHKNAATARQAEWLYKINYRLERSLMKHLRTAYLENIC